LLTRRHDRTDTPVNPQKQRTGLSRMLHAGGYSLAGLRAGWQEKAFRKKPSGHRHAPWRSGWARAGWSACCWPAAWCWC
jgi:hypothetical protein